MLAIDVWIFVDAAVVLVEWARGRLEQSRRKPGSRSARSCEAGDCVVVVVVVVEACCSWSCDT